MLCFLFSCTKNNLVKDENGLRDIFFEPNYIRDTSKFKKESDYKPIVAIIKSLVLSELVAPSQGTRGAGNIRLNFNNFLNNS